MADEVRRFRPEGNQSPAMASYPDGVWVLYDDYAALAAQLAAAEAIVRAVSHYTATACPTCGRAWFPVAEGEGCPFCLVASTRRVAEDHAELREAAEARLERAMEMGERHAAVTEAAARFVAYNAAHAAGAPWWGVDSEDGLLCMGCNGDDEMDGCGDGDWSKVEHDSNCAAMALDAALEALVAAMRGEVDE